MMVLIETPCWPSVCSRASAPTIGGSRVLLIAPCTAAVGGRVLGPVRKPARVRTTRDPATLTISSPTCRPTTADHSQTSPANLASR